MIKKIFNFLFNFILSVLVLLLIILSIISSTIFNKDYIKQKLDENKFYDKSYSDIKEGFENYTLQSGLDLDILDNLVSKQKVKNDIDSRIDSIFSGKKDNIEINSIRQELDSRINNALEKNNRVPSEQEKESIKKYEDAIVDSYKSGILYGKDFSIKIDFLKKAKIISLVAIIFVSVILLIINKNMLMYISCFGVSLLFSGILTSVIKFLLEKRIQHILILDLKFSNFLVNSLNNILEKFYNCGIVIIILGIILIIIGSLENLKKTIENKSN